MITGFYVDNIGWIRKSSADFISAVEESRNGRDVLKMDDGTNITYFNMSKIVTIQETNK